MKKAFPIVLVGIIVLAVLVFIVIVSPKLKPEPKVGLQSEVDVISIPSFFCDYMIELSITAENIEYYDGILNVEFECGLSSEQLIELVEDSSGLEVLYTVEQYDISGYTDLLILAQYDTCADWFLLREDDGHWNLTRMGGYFSGDNEELAILLPYHLIEDSYSYACYSEESSQAYFEFGKEYKCVGTVEDFYNFYCATGRYMIHMGGNQIYISGYTAAVSPELRLEDLDVYNDLGYGQSGTKESRYTLPILTEEVVMTFTEREGDIWFSVDIVDIDN